MNSNIVTVGKKIRQIREAVGLSRPKFADLLGVPPTTLKNYELGYREVGGAFLVALAHHRICTSSPSGCWQTRKSPKSARLARMTSPRRDHRCE